MVESAGDVLLEDHDLSGTREPCFTILEHGEKRGVSLSEIFGK